jgi:hypothetical protein
MQLIWTTGGSGLTEALLTSGLITNYRSSSARKSVASQSQSFAVQDSPPLYARADHCVAISAAAASDWMPRAQAKPAHAMCPPCAFRRAPLPLHAS